MKLTIVALFMMCAACTHISEIRTPSGNKGFTISCRDALFGAYSTSDCYQKAGESCPGGYIVLANEVSQHVVANTTQYGTFVNTYNARVLTVECK